MLSHRFSFDDDFLWNHLSRSSTSRRLLSFVTSRIIETHVALRVPKIAPVSRLRLATRMPGRILRLQLLWSQGKDLFSVFLCETVLFGLSVLVMSTLFRQIWWNIPNMFRNGLFGVYFGLRGEFKMIHEATGL